MAAKPLHILIFLLPLMIAYEIGTMLYLSKPGLVQTIGAHNLVGRLFEASGGVTLHIPTFLLVAVLIVWHLLLRDPWRVKPAVLLGMALESFLWTLPLLVLGLILDATITPSHGPGPQPAFVGSPLPPGQLPWNIGVTLSLGAGLYEELLFRLMLVPILHLILVDVMKVKNRWGSALAAILSGIAFALYHDLPPRDTATGLMLLAFFTVAGVYFGALFLLRGFGVVVATHAIYDTIVLVALRGSSSS